MMNKYCDSALHQIKVALDSVIEIIDRLEEGDLSVRPAPDKRSVKEQLEHLATICKADFFIASGWKQEEMNRFYASVKFKDLEEIKRGISDNLKFLSESYNRLAEIELEEKITSYWGVTYTRFEWLLEILAHVYHHRGQLYAQLVYGMGKELNILLFE